MGSTNLSNLLATLRQSITGKQPTLNKKTEEKNEEQLFGVVKKEEEKPVDLMNDSMFTGIVDFSNTKNDEPQKAEPAPLPAQPVTAKAGTTKLSKLLNNIRTQMTAPTTSVNNSVAINQPETQKVSNDVPVNKVENTPQVNNEIDNTPKIQPGERGSIEWLQELKSARDSIGLQDGDHILSLGNFPGLGDNCIALETDDSGRVTKLTAGRFTHSTYNINGYNYTATEPEYTYEISYNDEENAVTLKQLGSSSSSSDLMLTFNENNQIIERKFVDKNDSNTVLDANTFTYYENGKLKTSTYTTTNKYLGHTTEIESEYSEETGQVLFDTETYVVMSCNDDEDYCSTLYNRRYLVNNTNAPIAVQMLKDYVNGNEVMKADNITINNLHATDKSMPLTIEGNNNVINAYNDTRGRGYNDELIVKGDNNVIDLADGYDKLTIIGHNNIHKNVEEVNDLTPIDPIDPIQPGDVGSVEWFSKIIDDKRYKYVDSDTAFYDKSILPKGSIREILTKDEYGRITSYNRITNNHTPPLVEISYNDYDGTVIINYKGYGDIVTPLPSSIKDSFAPCYGKLMSGEISTKLDSNGNVIETIAIERNCDYGAGYSYSTFSYDEDGSMKQVEYYYSIEEFFKDEDYYFLYNNNNKICLGHKEKGKNTEYTDIEYNEDDFSEEVHFYDCLAGLVCIDKFDYIKSILEKLPMYYGECIYDSNGEVVSWSYYDENGNEISKSY